jgi:predicted nicotinamide N-methyase
VTTAPVTTPSPPGAHRQRLLARIHRRFQTVTEEVRLRDRLTLVFTRIADPNRVLDQVAEQEDLRDRLEGKRRPGDELHLPYWAELWDSALGIIDHLSDPASSPILNPDPRALNPLSVLDLGCGMGLTGAVAAALGARVTFADLEPDALLFARLNAIDYQDRVRTRRLNWRKDRIPERFDLIMGADILYDRHQWSHLEPFWRGHLRGGGQILLGEPGRQTGDLFLDWIRPHPWSLEQLNVPVPTRATPIRLLLLKPKN